MNAIHLALRHSILCRSERADPPTSTVLSEVTCSWCLHTLERIEREEYDALVARRLEGQHTAAAARLGVLHVWDALAAETASDRIIRGVFGAVLIGLVESHDEALAHAP